MEESKTPLIDKIYELLWRSEERVYPLGYHSPKFQIYVSREQLIQLRQEALNHYVFTIQSPNESFLFGQKLIVVDDTPYVKLVE
jgi:hypothetical protein